MEKLYGLISKTFLKMAGGRMRTPHLTPLDPPLGISYRNHQESMAYFSHLAPSILFFFTERLSPKKEGGMAHAPPLNTLLLETIDLEAETLHSC